MNKKQVARTLSLPDGTRKYFYGATIKEAEKKRDEAKLKVGLGMDLETQMTVAQLADIWFDAYKKGQLHTRSEETIQGILNRYILPKIGPMQVADVRPIHIQRMMSSISQLSKSTQKKVLQNTRQIFECGVENGLILKTPVAKSIKAQGADPKEQVPLTEEQCQQLLAAVEGTRAYPLVLVLMYGGLRIGEALGLRWADIDFEHGTVTVNRSIVYPIENRSGEINEELKTSYSHRTIPLPWGVISALKEEMHKSHSLWVFAMENGQFLSYSSFRALWRIIDYRTVSKCTGNREIVERTLDFDVHPHLLRHTCITRWFVSGLDFKEVQHLAGHASVDITLEVYTHYQESLRKDETAAKIQGERPEIIALSN